MLTIHKITFHVEGFSTNDGSQPSDLYIRSEIPLPEYASYLEDPTPTFVYDALGSAFCQEGRWNPVTNEDSESEWIFKNPIKISSSTSTNIRLIFNFAQGPKEISCPEEPGIYKVDCPWQSEAVAWVAHDGSHALYLGASQPKTNDLKSLRLNIFGKPIVNGVVTIR